MSKLPERALETPIRRFRPYPKYQDSGVEWFGKIPSHWGLGKLKTLLKRNDSGAWGEDSDYEGTIVLRSTDVTAAGNWELANPARRRLGHAEYKATLLEEGDLLVTKSSGSALHLGKTAIVTSEIADLNCCFSNFMQRLRVAPDSESRYVWHLLNSDIGRGQLNFIGSTTTGLANLNGKIVGSIYLPLAPQDEQRSIASFLDKEIARIDALIARKEQLIDLLQEKRTALITQSITKGLDPAVHLMNSGVEWLDKIPAHWSIKRLWHLTPSDRKIMYGIVLPGPNVPGGVPIVKGGDVAADRLLLELLNRTSPDIEASYVRSRLREGDLVFAIRGSIGEVAMIPNDLAGANLTQDAARISYSAETHGPWLLYALRSTAISAQLKAGALGATIKGINIRDLKRALLPIPPKLEQERIAVFLDIEDRRTEEARRSVRNAVERLQELRTALISAAVTGKIDVRGEVA